MLKIDNWDADLPTGDWIGPDPLPLFPQLEIISDSAEKLLFFRELHIQFYPTPEQHQLIIDWVGKNIRDNTKWLFCGLYHSYTQFQYLYCALPSIHETQTKYIPSSNNKHLKAVYNKDWDEKLDISRNAFIKFLKKIKCSFMLISDNQALDSGILEIKEYKRPRIICQQGTFPGTSNPQKKLWRYLTLKKFIRLLQDKDVWFSRPHFFDDPHELTMDLPSQRELLQWKLDSFAREYNRAIVSSLKSFILTTAPLVEGLLLNKDGKIEKQAVKLSNLSDILLSSIRKDIRKWQKSFCISCWRYSHLDSVAMWNQYASLDEGIAIVADLDKLRKTLNQCHDIRLAIIEYRDFSDESNGPMIMNPLTYKDIRYESESEARFYFRASLESQKGIPIPFDISEAVKEIQLSPNATDSFKNSIQDLLNKYELKIPLVKSSLGQVPNKF